MFLFISAVLCYEGQRLCFFMVISKKRSGRWSSRFLEFGMKIKSLVVCVCVGALVHGNLDVVHHYL